MGRTSKGMGKKFVKSASKKGAKLFMQAKGKKSASQKPKPMKPVAEEKKLEKKSRIRTPELLRGMKDLLPPEQKYWNYMMSKAESLAWGYGFKRIDTPILEETDLFIRTVGKQTDIVEKEMFSFVDQGGENVTLRPECTAPIARAYIEHGMMNLPQPVKLYYSGPMFRYDRPQAGRLREFHQVGFEVLGDNRPVADAQLIILAYHFCKELGLNVNVQVNSIGDVAAREEYKKELTAYFRSKRNQLSEDSKRRLAKNPLRILDSKEDQDRALLEDAPQIVDWLDDDSKDHFVKVLEYLDEVEVPYILNPHLVRGLDYYNRTTFEIWPAVEKTAEGGEEKRQNALGGGGRYDGLIASLGGKETPACGFALGMERLVLQLKETGVSVPEADKPQIFLAQLGEAAKRKALVLFEELRRDNIRVAENFSKDSLRAQLDAANKLGAKFTIIIGQKEVVDGTVLLRDMEGGIQEVVDFKKVMGEVKKRLLEVKEPETKEQEASE